MTQNPYEVLGVAKNATDNDIKQAYRKLAKEHHPDASGGSDDKFKEIVSAYEILSDPQKRKNFDNFGTTNPQRGNPFDDFFQGFGGNPFEAFFNPGNPQHQNSRPHPQQGTHVEHRISLTLEEVLSGIEREVKYFRDEKCVECDGEGIKKTAKRNTCSYCSGTGQKMKQQKVGNTVFRNVEACYACQGKGWTVNKDDECVKCNASGSIRVEHTQKIKVPAAGVSEGNYIQYRSFGNCGKYNGPYGDLMVIFHILEHPIFVRDEKDIHIRVPVAFSDCILKREIEIPLLGGSSMKVVPGSELGALKPIVKRGMGLPVLNSHNRGDFHIHFDVVIPDSISTEYGNLVQKMNVLDSEIMSKNENVLKLRNYIKGDRK